MAGSDVPNGEVYRGPCGIGRDSPWLTNEDLPHDRDVTAQIEKVLLRRNLSMQGGREKRVAVSLAFVGKDRELMLNATNRKVLAALFGANTGEWFGKKVALYVEQDVRRPDGTRGPAVRIRAKRLPQDGPAPKPAEAPPADPAPTGASAE